MQKEFFQILGFNSKEGTNGIYQKKYANCNNYCIEIDFKSGKINYGDLIRTESKSTQNFSQPENFVVLECVNRLLEKGYKPENIILEKTWATGHGTSGRLDVLITRDDGSAYLMIECKTYGKEFEKELARIKKDGGQLFTYFQQDRNADILMLYASELKNNQIIYENEIIKIEPEYRQTSNVKDFYERWSKLTKDNGVFDSWVKPYDFESKALTINDLVEIKQEDSSFIFNQFLEILRHNVVSDKGNAFNKIFTLFLCKIYDEKINEGTNNELAFQWLESDTHISFQLRLTDLYKEGMHEFLEKVVTDFSETEFNNQFHHLEEKLRNDILGRFNKIRLEKNNEFAIKDVYDEQSFNENAVVVKEIVELLQGYKLRYTKKQQYLSDFFELLLTTGLKQESGQFFTPVPVAQFIIKSLPIDQIVENKLANAKLDNGELLPYVMDYAAGSGHFITEIMHEFQRLLNTKNDKNYNPSIAKKLRNWKDDHFAWAIQYIYGVEKDYRLVKVGKVGCYLHGDGLANVIHSDGLARFAHPDYKGKLLNKDENFPLENKQFDIVVSNPPYSVSSFKNASTKYYQEKDFELYKSLTDNSSEIECLFIERTKQLLKDGGIAGIILPSSILSNTGIYTKAREIILQYFDIVGITELGSNTFMATGTNTVVVFLRRRNNYAPINLKKSIEQVFINLQDVTINGIERPIAKYINHVWKSINFDDYVSLLKSKPNEQIEKHEIYIEYRKKIKAKNDKEFFEIVLEKEKEKLFYFVLTYPQKVVLIKTGEKDAEKRFLGYEFSNRRGSEGIHPIQRGKHIEDCTKLFDPEVFENPEKASTYIYKAFTNDFDFPIHESLENNISRHDLVDMLTFDRVEFEKTLSLNVKKKVKIYSKWDLVKLGEISEIDYGTRIVKKSEEGTIYPVYGGGGETFRANSFNREDCFVISRFGMSPECIRFIKGEFFLNDSGMTLNTKQKNMLKIEYLNYYLFLNQERVYLCGRGVAQKNIDIEAFNSLQIPLPPINIQEKIVAEIEVLEKKEEKAKKEAEGLREGIEELFKKEIFNKFSKIKIGELAETSSGGTPLRSNFQYYENPTIPWLTSSEVRQGNIYKSESFISELGLKESSAKLFPINSVLLAMYGATAGQVGILRFEASTNQAICGILPNERYLPEFMFYHLKFQYEDLLKARTGVARDNLSQDKIKEFEIFIPPIEEQREIVSKIEKLEEKINQLEKGISLIPSLKEAVLEKYL